MATFHRTPRGSAYLDISWLQDMRGLKSITLIPILNQAYCPRCATSVLRRLGRYPEDAAIKKRRERFWLDYFGLEDINEKGE